MEIFGKFKKSKGAIAVQLDQTAYEATDWFTGRIVVVAEEEMPAEEFSIEISAYSKIRWRKKKAMGQQRLKHIINSGDRDDSTRRSDEI